jgi:hypothetical protein
VGLEPRLFTPLPDLPKRFTRKRRLIAELRLIEASLVDHLSGIANALDKRLTGSKSPKSGEGEGE